MKKIKFIIVLFLIISFSINAQEKKDVNEKKALELVKKIVSKFDTNEANKLTAKQQKMLKDIYLKKIAEVKLVKESSDSNEVKKEKLMIINKKYFKEIYDSVFTKEQRAFWKDNKETSEE